MPLDKKKAAQKAEWVDFAYNMFAPGVLRPPADPGIAKAGYPPRVGLLDFAASFNQAVPTSYRIWNTLDIVPQLPTFPFIHVSGLGDGIVQTLAQLETLVATPACEHHLTSYQWLLDAANFSLDPGCGEVSLHETAAAMALTVGHGPAQQKASGRAMLKAFSGHAE